MGSSPTPATTDEPQPTRPPSLTTRLRTTPATGEAPDAACLKSDTVLASGSNACSGALIFEDNFTRLDANKWRIEQRFSTGPDYEFNFYTNHSQSVRIERDDAGGGGDQQHHLSIGVRAMPGDFDAARDLHFGPDCTGRQSSDECEVPAHMMHLFTPPLASGQITTRRSFSFTYGRAEIRARLPNGDWLLPQLLLQPLEPAYGADGLDSGLMRVASATRGLPLRGGVLIDASAAGPWRTLHQCWKPNSVGLWSSDWRVYALEWRPSE